MNAIQSVTLDIVLLVLVPPPFAFTQRLTFEVALPHFILKHTTVK